MIGGSVGEPATPEDPDRSDRIDAVGETGEEAPVRGGGVERWEKGLAKRDSVGVENPDWKAKVPLVGETCVARPKCSGGTAGRFSSEGGVTLRTGLESLSGVVRDSSPLETLARRPFVRSRRKDESRGSFPTGLGGVAGRFCMIR